ncbi:MAG TPA: hypothetical protein PK165_02575 [bacterium]|nr:hypothetical protein [bacterium]HOL49312.1 hypothetical protein [bacterium]HPO51701.1 hypothetical protein [bacterium]
MTEKRFIGTSGWNYKIWQDTFVLMNRYKQTQTGFVFSGKVHRSITHIKRFIEVEEAWKTQRCFCIFQQ